MRYLYPLLAIAVALGTVACEGDSCTESWTQVMTVPVTADRAAVQDSIAALPPRELCTGGNLYAYGDYLFVNVNREGYHVLDNTDPRQPRNVAFLQVPGATHMAFVDGRMVSDSYADMLVLEFGGPDDLTLLSSTPNLLLQTDGFEVGEDVVAVGFEEREVTFTEDCSGLVDVGCPQCDVGFERLNFASDMGAVRSGNVQVNTGGSLARLAFCDRMLYVLARDRLTTFRLEGQTLVNARETQLGGGQEALVLDGAFLYAASEWGLTVLEVGDCGLPVSRGFAPRFWNNDPVAVAGDRAVVALRNGNTPTDRLDGRLIVYDLSDRTNPRELATFPMAHPVGVALRQNRLYVCDGIDGLLVYDFDPDRPGDLGEARVQTIAEADVVDLAVLPYDAGPVLFTVGQQTVAQFAIDGDGLLSPLSTLSAQRCAVD